MTEPVAVDPRFHVPARRVLLLLLLLAVIFWFARTVLLPFAVAALIAYAFSPYVDRVQRRTGRSRVVIVLALVAVGLVAILAIVAAFAGPVSREVALLVRAGPDALETALRQLLGSESIALGDRVVTVEDLAAQLQVRVSGFLQTPEGALRAAQSLLQGTVDLALVAIVTFYLLLDGHKFAATALRFVNPDDRAELVRVGGRIHGVVGRWLRGQLVLVVIVSTIVTLVFGLVLHLPYPLALGLLVGLLDVITFIGPIVAGVVCAIVALATGGVPLAIATVVFLFVLRQAEDVFLMPIVLGRAVNLHPLAALFAVVVGATAFGIVGTFLAVPVAAAINVALHEFFPAELGALPSEPESTETPAVG